MAEEEKSQSNTGQQVHRLQLPAAEFIDDIGAFVGDATAESKIKELTRALQQYKSIEGQQSQSRAELQDKLPGLKDAAACVDMLIEKQNEDEVLVDYQLDAGLFATAKLSRVKHVCLWLGADVMLEYTLDEAKTLLADNTKRCHEQLKMNAEALAYVREQMIVLEVNIQRLRNHSILQRKAAARN